MKSEWIDKFIISFRYAMIPLFNVTDIENSFLK